MSTPLMPGWCLSPNTDRGGWGLWSDMEHRKIDLSRAPEDLIRVAIAYECWFADQTGYYIAETCLEILYAELTKRIT